MFVCLYTLHGCRVCLSVYSTWLSCLFVCILYMVVAFKQFLFVTLISRRHKYSSEQFQTDQPGVAHNAEESAPANFGFCEKSNLCAQHVKHPLASSHAPYKKTDNNKLKRDRIYHTNWNSDRDGNKVKSNQAHLHVTN